MTGCTILDFFDLADQLPEVTRVDNGRYWRIAVGDRTFGYLEAWRQTAPAALIDLRDDRLAR